MAILPETELMQITAVTEEERSGSYLVGPLSPGYGVTIGNSLRRVLLSSLEGSAISAVRIEGVTHEFGTLPGMNEDVVALILNLKSLRVKLLSDEPATLRLTAKGPGEVRAKQFAANSQVEIIDPEHYLASLDKAGKLEIEVLVERGRGYVSTESRLSETHPLGTISVDSIFTPIRKVHYEVEHTRVGGMTNFDNLSIDITTDGTIHPREALAQAANILLEHLSVVAAIRDIPEVATPKKAAKKSKKSEEAVETVETEVATEEVVEKPAKKSAKKTADKTSPKTK